MRERNRSMGEKNKVRKKTGEVVCYRDIKCKIMKERKKIWEADGRGRTVGEV